MPNLADRIEKASGMAMKLELVSVGGLISKEGNYDYELFVSPLIACDVDEKNYSGSFLAYLLSDIEDIFEFKPYGLRTNYEYFIFRRHKKYAK